LYLRAEREGRAFGRLKFDLPGFLPGVLPDLPIAHGGYVVSDLEPVSTSALYQALYQQEIGQLQDKLQELTTSLLAAQTARDASIAVNVRQARQIVRQSVRMGSLARKLATATAENSRLKAGQPRLSGKRYPQRLGGV